MPNPESLNFSNTEPSTAENFEKNKTNQQRGDKANRAAAEQAKANKSRFDTMSIQDLMKTDPSSLSSAELTQYIEKMTIESKKAKQREQNQSSPSLEVSRVTRVEKISNEAARTTMEKAKGNDRAKGFISKKAMAALVAVSIAAGGIIGYFGANMQNASATPDNDQVGTEQSVEDEKIGIQDGYGEKGMWESETKSSPNAFASATEVAEVCNNDEREMVKYTARNQVESFADYLANLPEQLQPEGFKGLSIQETEKKLESLSDEEFENVQDHFDQTMDKALIRKATLNGTYRNAFMRKIDENGDTVHNNMEVVSCSTNEHDMVITQFYWPEVNGKMDCKINYDEKGNIAGGCIQIVNEDGVKSYIYYGMPVINAIDTKIETPTPDKPTPDKPTPDKPTPDNPPDKEWGKSGDPHGGDKVKPSEPVNPDSRVTKEQNDNTNAGNKGNAETKPGSSSGSNNEQRVSGGENQGGNKKAGENTKAPAGNPEVDKKGNDAQAEAQKNKTPGGNNTSDAAEEKAVENGDF